MSRAIFEAPIIAPLLSRIGEIVTETSTSVPSLRARMVSKCLIPSPSFMRARMSDSSLARPAGINMRIGLPTASADEYPNNFLRQNSMI